MSDTSVPAEPNVLVVFTVAFYDHGEVEVLQEAVWCRDITDEPAEAIFNRLVRAIPPKAPKSIKFTLIPNAIEPGRESTHAPE